MLSAGWQSVDIALWSHRIQFFPLDFWCNYGLRLPLWLVGHWHFEFVWFWDEKATLRLWIRRGLVLPAKSSANCSRTAHWGKHKVGQRARAAGSLLIHAESEIELKSASKGNVADLYHALDDHTADSCLLYPCLKLTLQHSLSIIPPSWCSCSLDASSTTLGQLTGPIQGCVLKGLWYQLAGEAEYPGCQSLPAAFCLT